MGALRRRPSCLPAAEHAIIGFVADGWCFSLCSIARRAAAAVDVVNS